MFFEAFGFDNDNFEVTSKLKFYAIDEIEGVESFGIKENVWYDVIDFLDGLPTIELDTGDIFTLTEDELAYVEIHDTYINKEVMDMDDLATQFPEYFAVEESYTTDDGIGKKTGMDKYKENKYLNDLSFNVTSKETKPYIEAVEKANVQNTIDRLLDQYNKKPTKKVIKELTTLSKYLKENT